MKRSLESSDSLGTFIPIRPSAKDEKMTSPRRSNTCTSFLFTGMQDFPTILDGEGLDDDSCLEEMGHGAAAGEKKRRLNVEQVKALEKNFEIENKLEPDRKVKLAQELGLQPRQVAVWFQNRRARWKTKQLERDYGLLKANYEALKLSRDSLQRDNDALLMEIKELKAKLNMEETGTSHNISIEDEVIKAPTPPPPPPPAMSNDDTLDMSHIPLPTLSLEASSELEYETFNIFPPAESFKDGPADSSDSSAVLNEDYSPTAAATAAEMTIGCFGQFVKMEEHGDLFSGEEACKLFADDEQWYCSDQWGS